MDKLKEYLNRPSAIEAKYPHLEAQGACFEIPSTPQTVEYLNRTSAIEDKYPHLEAQGACFEIPSPPQTVVPEITDEEEENVETPQVCYINTVMIKPTAEEASEDRVRAQSYIPQDPLHANSPPTTIKVKPPQIIPSTSAHRTISRAPSTADEAEEGILGAKTYESVSYVPAGTLTLQPIPAPAASASEKANRTIFQRISAFFS
uniref:Uncharacterized protein n=1 Tax=Panagrolaimus sp. ES5 TaxID=591445 RepID=A0AC34G680_9BILA